MSTGGQALGGLVGGIAGAFFGGPTGAMYGAQIGLMLGGYLDPPKGPTTYGPRLDDLTVQTSTYGTVIPRVYGTVAINGNVIWLENNAIRETLTKNKSGGKGGQAKATTVTATYSATFAVGLCKGPIIGVRRIWIRGGLYYDAGSTDPDTIQASNDNAVGFRVYRGTDTQTADARMQATLGAANTPAWRGLAYLVFDDLPLADYGNSLMGAQIRAEVYTTSVAAVVVDDVTLPSGDDWQVAWSSVFGGIMLNTRSFDTNNILRSTDSGLTWTAATLPQSRRWHRVAVSASGSTAICVGHIDGVSDCICRTTDGTTWSYYALPAYYGYWGKPAHNGTVWCIPKDDGALISTDNALTWTLYTYGMFPGSNAPRALAVGARLIVFNFVDTVYKTSDNNGVSWTNRTLPAQGIYSATTNGARVVVILNDRTKYVVSEDAGTTWGAVTTIPIPAAALSSYYNVEYTNGVFLFVGSRGEACYSSDCVTFTAIAAIGIPTEILEDSTASTGTSIFGVSTNYLTARRWTINVVPGTVPLSQIVSAECQQSSLLTAGDINVTSLTAAVRGYPVGTVGAIRSALEPLQAAWPFDVRQHGYQIEFVARGGSSVITIPAADLDARSAGTAPGVQITIGREMDSQMPKRVTIRHLDYDREYDPGSQYAERLNTAAINVSVIDLPIVMTATEAIGKAEVLLYLYWLERHDVAINLPPTYNQLEPGDVVTLTTPEGNVSLRLTAVHYTSDNRVECQAKYANAAIYTPTAVAAAPAVTGPTTITPIGASIYALLDLPMLHTAQSGPSFLAAMTGALDGWKGGALLQSIDAGSTWAILADFGPPGAVIGTVTNSIGAVDSRVVDDASVLSVTMTQGDLYSCTLLAMLAGANTFAYGADGRWEIISARSCVLASGSTYTVQGLLRGRYGTEWAMSLHAANDTLILLDPAEVAVIDVSTSLIGLSTLYRGITFNRDLDTDSNRAFTYLGVNLKPLSPISLSGNRDASTNDWSLTWIRRTRTGGEWRDYVDAALGETQESYQIDVFSDGTYAAVKRTIATNTAAASYSSVDQVTDFGGNQTTLYVKIYQLSATIGRGYPLISSITR